jgi:hypothetical protein
MSKRTTYGKFYRLDIRVCHPDVRMHPRLPRGRVFTCGRVFTVRADGKKRVSVSVWTLEIIYLFCSCPLEKKKIKFRFLVFNP